MTTIATNWKVRKIVVSVTTGKAGHTNSRLEVITGFAAFTDLSW